MTRRLRLVALRMGMAFAIAGTVTTLLLPDTVHRNVPAPASDPHPPATTLLTFE